MQEKKTTKLYEFIKENYKIFIKDLIFIAILAFLVFYKLPYLIYKPGGSINISDRIVIEDSLGYEGSYSMNYVSVQRGTIPSVLCSFLFKDWDLVKEEKVVIENTDYETTFKLEQLDLQNSVDTAMLLAYAKAGKTVNIKSKEGTVIYTDANANTNITSLDKLISINGKNYSDYEDLQGYIQTLEINEKVDVVVEQNGKEITKYAHVYEYEDRKVLGISIANTYTYETDPAFEYQTKNTEAGSSGGLMLTLAIYDGLISEDLTSGKKIMGTGTISASGAVGAIGGVKYKMLGAKKDKADVFFVPKDNYDEALEVYNKYKFSFDLVMVETLDDAINYLNSIK